MDQVQRNGQGPLAESVVSCQLYLWLNPDLRLTFFSSHVHMYPPLFPGEEEEPEALGSEDRGTHVGIKGSTIGGEIADP